MRSLGSRIREARVKLGLSQVECAKKLGVTNVQLSRWERGVVVPRPVTLAKVRKVLDLEDLEEHEPIGGSPKSEARFRLREIRRHAKRLAKLMGELLDADID